MRLLSALLMIFAGITAAMAADTDAAKRPLVAVYDFTVSPDLDKKGITGWSIAEEMESKLMQTGKYRIITRAKIATVLKEKNIDAGSSLSPAELGKVCQAEYIVTGKLRKQDNRLVMTAKLLDVSKVTGELEKSFDAWIYDDPDEKLNEPVFSMTAALAEKLTMTPGEFLEYGLVKLNARDYEPAFEAFREMQRATPFDKIKSLLENIKKNPPPDSQLDVPASARDAGRQFDWALALMAKGEDGVAAKMLYGIQKNNQVGELIKLVEATKDLIRNHSEKMEASMEDASRKYLDALKNKDRQEKGKDSLLLCDEALSLLHGILNDKNTFISPSTRRRAEQMAAKIETLKKSLPSGPLAGGMQYVPDNKESKMTAPAVAAAPDNKESKITAQAVTGQPDNQHKAMNAASAQATTVQILYQNEAPAELHEDWRRARQELSSNTALKNKGALIYILPPKHLLTIKHNGMKLLEVDSVFQKKGCFYQPSGRSIILELRNNKGDMPEEFKWEPVAGNADTFCPAGK